MNNFNSNITFNLKYNIIQIINLNLTFFLSNEIKLSFDCNITYNVNGICINTLLFIPLNKVNKLGSFIYIYTRIYIYIHIHICK